MPGLNIKLFVKGVFYFAKSWGNRALRCNVVIDTYACLPSLFTFYVVSRNAQSLLGSGSKLPIKVTYLLRVSLSFSIYLVRIDEFLENLSNFGL